MSSVLKAEFEPFVESTLNAGLKNSAQTKKVAVNAISSCVKTVISNTSSTKHLNVFYTSLSEKNAGLRMRVSDFILAMLKSSSQNNISKSLDILDKIIQKTITDASHEVRQLAKEIFSVYSEKFPVQAER